MKSLKIALLASTLVFGGAAAVLASTPEGNGSFVTASYSAPESNGNVTTASYKAPSRTAT